MKMRLDELLVERDLCATRSQAKALIMTGKVRSGTVVLDKPGKSYDSEIELTVLEPPKFVSRGGEKLEGFLDRFEIDPTDCTVLDVGASTGGFTDCLLQRGAVSSTCVDVGRAQLHGKLLSDPRVTNMEKINARYLTADTLPQPSYDIVVMDLSFISLRKVLPAVWPLVNPAGLLIILVKPQFEATKQEVDKAGGVIRDEAIQDRVLEEIRTFARQELPSSTEIGIMESPIRGTDGNREFLLGLKMDRVN